MSNTLEKVDELGGKVFDLLNTTVDSVPTAIEHLMRFVETEAPLLAQDIINYGRAFAIMSLILWSGVAGTFIWSWIKSRESDKKDPKGDPSFENVRAIIMTVIFAVVTVWFIAYLGDGLKAWFAPRLYILEYIKDIVTPRLPQR